MGEEIKPGDPVKPGEGGNPPTAEDIQKLQKQVDSLTEGIAKYRDDAQKADKKATAAEKALEDLKNKIDFEADEEEVPLTKEDQEKLKIWAKNQGFVTKEEMEAEKARLQTESIKDFETQAVQEFLGQHPEYNDEKQWAKLAAEFAQYKIPSTLQGFRNILTKIHKEFTGEGKTEDAKAAAKAELIAKGRLSIHGGSQKGTDEAETLDDLHKKYPNLSKEQIAIRVAEIDNLYPKKEK